MILPKEWLKNMDIQEGTVIEMEYKKKIIKKIVRVAAMIKKRKKTEDIRSDSDMEFSLKASHVTTVRNAIPNIQGYEPLASILENPSNQNEEPIDHIDNFRKYLKNCISYKE